MPPRKARTETAISKTELIKDTQPKEAPIVKRARRAATITVDSKGTPTPKKAASPKKAATKPAKASVKRPDVIVKPVTKRSKKIETEQPQAQAVTLEISKPENVSAEETALRKSNRKKRNSLKLSDLTSLIPEPVESFIKEDLAPKPEQNIIPTAFVNSIVTEPSAQEAHVPTTEPPSESEAQPIRKRSRGRGRGRDREQDFRDGEKPQAREPQAPSKPQIPQDEPLPRSKNRIGVLGSLPVLVLDDKIVPPLFFFGFVHNNASESEVMAQIQKAGNAGVHNHILLIELVIDEGGINTALDDAAYLLKRTLIADPEAKIFWRVVFSPAPNWKQRFTEAVYQRADGSLADPSICADRWWQFSARCLEHLVRNLQDLPQGDRIVGYHLERGEWFYGKSDGYDTSPAARDAFRKWVRNRYEDSVVALRAAWYDADINFANVEIPAYQPTLLKNVTSLYDSRRERAYVDYHLFLSDAVVDRIIELAKLIKKITNNRALVAASYGYTFEWSHANSGHLSLAKLLNSQYVDIVAGPPSYSEREPTGTGAFPCPIDSMALRGKMYLSEEDIKTPNSKPGELDDYNPQIPPQAMEQVHNRGLGVSLTHGSAAAWMDLWGNGWLNVDSVWQRAERNLDWWKIQAMNPPGNPEVAVIVDERSIAHSRDRQLTQTLLQEQRAHLLRAGISAGFYLMSDLKLKDFPDCRLYLFLNAWNISDDMRLVIRERLHRDRKTLCWLYAAGVYANHKPALEQAREATGAAIKLQPFASQPGTIITSKRHRLTEFMEGSHLSRLTNLDTTFYVTTEEAQTLGEYEHSGLPSISVKEYEGTEKGEEWRSVFIGEPTLPASLLRGLCNLAGVHIWNHTDDVTQIRRPFVVIHASHTGPRTITFPERMSAYSLTEKSMLIEDALNLKINMKEGETQILVIARQDQMAGILDTSKSPSSAPEALKVIEYVSTAPPAPAINENFMDEVITRKEQPLMTAEQSQQQLNRNRRRRNRGPRDRDEMMPPTQEPVYASPPQEQSVVEPAVPSSEQEPEKKKRGRPKRVTTPQPSAEAAPSVQQETPTVTEGKDNKAGVQFRFRKKDKPRRM